MGQHVVNTEFFPKGEGTTGSPLKVRLHLGDEDVDEDPVMTRAIFRTLVGYRAATNRTSFDTDFIDWMDSEASTAANVFQDDFAGAAWVAL